MTTGGASRCKHLLRSIRTGCHARKRVPRPRCQKTVGRRGSRGAVGPREQLQQHLQLLPINPNPNRQPLPWQEVKQPEVPAYTQSNSWQEGKQVPACVQSGWPLFSNTGEDADPNPNPNSNSSP